MEDLVIIKSRRQSPTRKVFVKTYGCQMNEYDTEKIYQVLASQYQRTDCESEADLIIFNTCSVRERPEQKLFSELGKTKELREKNKNLLVGVGGCVAQDQGAEILKYGRKVDFVFGTHNISLVPSLVEQRLALGQPQVAVDYREDWESLPLEFDRQTAARASVFIAISRGCDKNCTYCIVPRTRGKEVSRPYKEIEREIKLAVHRGAKEVVLLGQTVNSWGKDLQPKDNFISLLERLSAIEGLSRIRYTSPHPQEFRDDFIEFLRSSQKVCHHIHLPLQAGSDRILKAMNRNYRARRYLQLCEGLKEAIPDISITTDIIVGFPGEEDEDFEDTLQVMRQVGFDNCYAFVFSPRPQTVAAGMRDDTPLQIKQERLARLLALQEEITTKKLAAWVGKTVTVLLDGVSEHDEQKLHGRSSQNISVNLTRSTPTIKVGDLVDVRIVNAARFSLRGELTGD